MQTGPTPSRDRPRPGRGRSRSASGPRRRGSRGRGPQVERIGVDAGLRVDGPLQQRPAAEVRQLLRRVAEARSCAHGGPSPAAVTGAPPRDRVGARSEPATLALVQRGDGLGEDRQRRLAGGRAAEIEPGRPHNRASSPRPAPPGASARAGAPACAASPSLRRRRRANAAPGSAPRR